MQVENIKLSLVDRPADPIREYIDPDMVRELAESIREIGLQEPVIVRPLNGRYEIVAGDRRYLAHKLFDAPEIMAIVRELSDEEVLIVRATENDQREDLTPMERARVYGKMRDQLGYATEKIARKMGRASATIKMYLDLLDMEPEFQEAIDKKTIAISTANELRKIDDPEFRRYYLEAAVQNGVTREVAQRWAADYEKSKQAKYYAEGGGMPVATFEGDIKPTFLTCAGCHGPVEVREARSYIFCAECQKELKRG